MIAKTAPQLIGLVSLRPNRLHSPRVFTPGNVVFRRLGAPALSGLPEPPDRDLLSPPLPVRVQLPIHFWRWMPAEPGAPRAARRVRLGLFGLGAVRRAAVTSWGVGEGPSGGRTLRALLHARDMRPARRFPSRGKPGCSGPTKGGAWTQTCVPAAPAAESFETAAPASCRDPQSEAGLLTARSSMRVLVV